MGNQAMRCGAMTLFLALAFGPGRAEAQFWGGWGLYNPENGGVVAKAIDQRSLQAGQAAYSARSGGGGGGVVAPVEAMDQAGYQQFMSYDVATRRAIEERVARHPETPAPRRSAPAATATSAQASAPPPPRTVSLGNFFNRYGEFVWIADAPAGTDLLPARSLSDQAVALVLKEYQAQGIAPVSAVTDARRKLLDYGRPALDFVRKTKTPAVADTFHVFLMSLYTNLEMAASVPKTIPPAPAIPPAPPIPPAPRR